MADGLDAGRQIALPDIIQIVGDAGVLDVLAGVDDGPGRGADARGRLMIEEGDGSLLDGLACRNRERPFGEEVLLIDQHEQDIVP